MTFYGHRGQKEMRKEREAINGLLLKQKRICVIESWLVVSCST